MRQQLTESSERKFHMRLIELGGNLQVLDVVRRLQDFQLFLVSRENVDDDMAKTRTCHGQIVTAIESRDEGWAEAVARRHIHSAFDILKQKPIETWGRITEEGRSIPLKS